jgi:hypothetical protein
MVSMGSAIFKISLCLELSRTKQRPHRCPPCRAADQTVTETSSLFVSSSEGIQVSILG